MTFPKALLRMPRLRALVIFTLLGIALCLPAWTHPTGTWIGSDGDADTLMWLLRWTPWALQHGTNPLFTDRIIAPRGVNLMWNTAIFLPALVMAPITLTLGVVAAYNTLMTLGLVLSAWCGYLVARRWAGDERAALVGGLIYGFSPFMLAQLTFHISLVIAWEPPLLLLLLDEILVRQKRSPMRLGLALGLLVGAQFLVMEDVVLSSALMVAVLGAVIVARNWERARTTWRRPALSLAIGLALATAIVAYPLGFQLFGPYPVHGQFHPVGSYVGDPLNLIVPTSIQMLSGSSLNSVTTNFPGFLPEQTLYIGVPLLALVCAYAWRNRRNRTVRFMALGAAVALVFAVGANLHLDGRVSSIPLPGIVLEHLPFLSDMILSRFALYIDLFVAILAALATRDWLVNAPTRRARYASGAALVLVAATLFPKVPLATTADTTPSFFTSTIRSAIPENAMVLVAPFAYDPGEGQTMQWQAESGLWYSMPEGYIISGISSPVFPYGPPISTTYLTLEALRRGWHTPQQEEIPTIRAQVLADLKQWDVNDIVVGPMPHRAETVAFLTWVTGTAPQETGGVELWRLQ